MDINTLQCYLQQLTVSELLGLALQESEQENTLREKERQCGGKNVLVTAIVGEELLRHKIY